ncbi:MAG TPA: PD-(D/E)XK nuclease family protein [Candidatus Aminicenantes bacterium]|nr:PD-(D/E)XK nuclease family protein [Candidatus Aminicenantes bacterium]
MSLVNVPLKENLLERVAQALISRGKENLSDYCILLPTKRSILFFRKTLGDKVSGNFFPPKLLTSDTLFEELYRKERPRSRKATHVEGVCSLWETLKVLSPEGIFGAPSQTMKNFSDFFPRGVELLRALEEILTEAEFPSSETYQETFRQYVELGEYHQDYKGFIELLPRLSEAFTERMEAEHLYTRGITYKRVGEEAQRESFSPPQELFWICGLQALNRRELALFQKLLKRSGSCLFLQADSSHLENPFSPFAVQRELLEDLNLNLPSNEEGEVRGNPEMKVFPVGGKEEEMALLASLLDKRVNSLSADELLKVGILLPDPSSLIPFVQGVVSRLSDQKGQGPAFNITLPYPFERTPLFELVDILLGLGEEKRGIPGDLYLRFLRHPYVKTSDDENLLVRRTIHLLEGWLEEHNTGWVDKGFLEFDLAGELGELLESQGLRETALSLHRHWIPPKEGALLGLIDSLKRSLEGVLGENRPLFVLEYGNAALNALEELSLFVESHGELFPSLEQNYRGPSSLIREWLRNVSVPFDGTPLRGIQVMGPLEFRTLDFTDLYVLDLQEGNLPQSRKSDPLLPTDVRRSLGMRDSGQWEDLFSVHFFSTVAKAHRVNLFYREESGGKKRSRFVERILFEEEKRGAPSPLRRYPLPFQLSRSLSQKSVPKREWMMERLSNMAFSATTLGHYLSCPLSFFYQSVASLKEREELLEEPDGKLMGSILHEVLKEFYEKRREPESRKNLGREELERVLTPLLEGAFQRQGFNPREGLQRARFWLALRRLLDFLHEDLQGDFKILGLERKYERLFSYRGRQYALKGTLDRLEREEGRVTVWDYKSGSSQNPGSGFEEGKDPLEGGERALFELEPRPYREAIQALAKGYKGYGFQLFLYLFLLEGRGELGEGERSAGLIFLREEKESRRRSLFNLRGERNREPDVARARCKIFENHLGQILQDIFERREFIALPSQESCRYCPFKSLCGTPF